MKAVAKHSHASLWPREVVTLGVLFALKGVGTRAVYRGGGEPRLAGVVSSSARAYPALSPVCDSSPVDGRISGRPLGLGRGG